MAEERAKKSTNDAEKDSEILPIEVMDVILMKLPVESLARFKAVKKSWAETISSPQFNIRRLKSHRQPLYLMWGRTPTSDTFFLMRFDFVRSDLVEEHKTYRLKPALPLCSNNAILLLKSIDGDEIYLSLANLTVRSKIKILTLRMNEDFAINHGHFYDPRADDYKVVIISRERSGEVNYSVYSCRNRTWTEKKPFPIGEGFKHEEGLFVNGFFYWWVQKEGKVVGFDVREGTLGESGGPAELMEVDSSDEIKLGEVTGRLCLCSKNQDWTNVRVWVMEKKNRDECCFGVWRKMMSIDGDKILEQSCLGEEDRVVCFSDGTLAGSNYFVYDDEFKCYESFDCDISDEQCYNWIPYSKSLFSPHRYYRRVQGTQLDSSQAMEQEEKDAAAV